LILGDLGHLSLNVSLGLCFVHPLIHKDVHKHHLLLVDRSALLRKHGCLFGRRMACRTLNQLRLLRWIRQLLRVLLVVRRHVGLGLARLTVDLGLIGLRVPGYFKSRVSHSAILPTTSTQLNHILRRNGLICLLTWLVTVVDDKGGFVHIQVGRSG